MLFSNPPPNPYRPTGDVRTAPFAGRQKAYEFLYKRLTNPEGADTSLVLGRSAIGKTALLTQFNHYFGSSVFGIYVPLRELSLASERDWWNDLSVAALRALSAEKIVIGELPEPAPDDTTLRRWFMEDLIPQVLISLGRNRRLTWLLDDVSALVQWQRQGILPADFFAMFESFLRRFPAMGCVLALDARYEADIPLMSPLVQPAGVFRLTALTETDTLWLLRSITQDRYDFTEDAAAALYRATGGYPRLIQRFGFLLFQEWAKNETFRLFTADDIRQLSTAVSDLSGIEFQQHWSVLGINEQRVLVAITQLVFADPLKPVDIAGLERWLIESDHPLDNTAIRAAVRSLEYDEWVEQGAGGIRISAGLLQQWLLEHGRFDRMTAQTTGRARPRGRRRWLVLVLLFAAAVVALIVFLAQQPTETQFIIVTGEPTVTLVTTPQP
jgi:hypothetical protein